MACLATTLLVLAAASGFAQELFERPAGVVTRWYSFENPAGAPGQGGRANEAPASSAASG